MGAEALLLSSLGRADVDGRGQREAAAFTCFLQVGNFGTQPGLFRAAVINECAVTIQETLAVILRHFSAVTIENRQNNLEPTIEKKLVDRRHVLDILIVMN